MLAVKRYAELILKILLSLGALVYVLDRVSLDRVFATIASVNLWAVIAALVFFNLSKIVSSLRLNYFFRILGVELGEIEALRLYYIGMFYNLFLPGGIGGDGYKIYLLKRHRGASAKALLGVTLLDRISGLSALLFFAGILFLLSRYSVLYSWLVPLVWLELIAVYPVMSFFYRGKTRDVLISTTLLGMATQLLQLACAWCLVVALDLQGVWIETLTLFLLSSVAAVLPLSIGGIGIREFVFLYGFGELGLPVEKGVAFSMLFFLITALSSFVGVMLRHGLEVPATTGESGVSGKV